MTEGGCRRGIGVRETAHRLLVAAAVDLPADFAPGARGQPTIGLTRPDAVLLGQLDQPFDRAQQQMVARGMRDSLHLRRGVDGDPLHLRFVDRLGARRSGQRFGGQTPRQARLLCKPS